MNREKLSKSNTEDETKMIDYDVISSKKGERVIVNLK
jgi:hypothetical protein